MFSDFGFAGNLIELSNITGYSLATLTPVFTIHTSEVVYPRSFLTASPHSFRHGIEATAAEMHSGATGHKIHLSDDSLNGFPSHNKYINNMPKNQKVGDFVRVVKTETAVIAIEEDLKTRTLGKSEDQEYGVYCVGAVDIKDELKSVRLIAQKALNNSMPITQHMIALKNDPKNVKLALKYVETTGKVEDANQLIGFPCIMSNRHNDPSNQV